MNLLLLLLFRCDRRPVAPFVFLLILSFCSLVANYCFIQISENRLVVAGEVVCLRHSWWRHSTG